MQFKNLLLPVCGATLSCLALASCHLEQEPIPAEELYLRAFVKKYGIIAPDQDWNQAKRSTVTVLTNHADHIDVFVKLAGVFYRVATYADVAGRVPIPVDIPEECSDVYVRVDGDVFTTKAGGAVDATAPAQAPSRATGTEPISSWKDLGWLLVAEDLGATDDYDFNDIIIRIEATNMNTAALTLENKWWQVIEDGDEHLVLSRDAESRANKEYTRLRVTSMCAGGILDSYLHYRSKDNRDFILGPGGDWDLTSASSNTGEHEWHTWFDESSPSLVKNGRHMINTNNLKAATKSSTIIVDDDFSMEHYTRVYKDYDGDTDTFDDNNKFNNDNKQYAAWSFDDILNNKVFGFYITVGEPTIEACKYSDGNVLTQPKPGTAPQIFLIPDAGWNGYWHWPAERVTITSVYPRFAKWVKGTDADWFTDTPAQYIDGRESSPYYER